MEIYDNGIIQSALLADQGVIHGISTKALGNMSFLRSQHGRAPNNFQKLLLQLGIKAEKSVICMLPTKNTAVMARVKKAKDRGRIMLTPDREKTGQEITQWSCGDLSFRHLLPDYDEGTDAAVSKSPGLYLGMYPADCAPVFLYDPQTHYFGLVHAGIIGALTDIVPATIRYLQAHCRINPATLLAYIGPSICSKCYQPDKSRHWQHFKDRLNLLQNCFDLKDYIFNQLLVSGLQTANIEISQYCTACSSDLFYSNHRAIDIAKEGRQLAIIGIKTRGGHGVNKV